MERQRNGKKRKGGGRLFPPLAIIPAGPHASRFIFTVQSAGSSVAVKSSWALHSETRVSQRRRRSYEHVNYNRCRHALTACSSVARCIAAVSEIITDPFYSSLSLFRPDIMITVRPPVVSILLLSV